MNGQRERRHSAGRGTIGAVMLLAGLAALSGCASRSVHTGGVGSPSAAGTETSTSGSETTASPSSSPACTSGPVELSFHVGEPTAAQVCVHVGAKVGVTWFGAPGYAWSPIASSDTGIVSVSSRTTDGGPAAGSALAQATAPGVAELSTTASFTGDKSGPPTVRWTVTVRVVP